MIILIDNYDSFTYNLYQMLIQMGEEVKVVRNDEMSVDEILEQNPSKIIFSPGPGKPSGAGICIQLIKKASGKVPLLGVCLGMQAMAEAFGGKIIRADECVHGKPERIFHSRKDIYENLSLPFTAGRYHSLIIDKESLPKEFIIEAETANGTIMGIKHISDPTYGVQFHPESILTPEGELLLKRFLQLEAK